MEGAGDLSWTISANKEWLSVSSSSGSEDNTIIVFVNRDSYEVGDKGEIYSKIQ